MTIERAAQLAWEWLWQPAPYTRYPWAAVLGLVLGILAAVGITVGVLIPWARRWWADATLRPDEDERGVSTKEMSLTEHLLELRTRLLIAIGALAVATGIAFIFYQTWMDIALLPIQGHKLQAITPTEKVFAYFKVTLVVGLVVSMPIIAYEVWAYVAPGLTRQERRYVLAIVPGATLSFVVGILFAYFALTPAALAFLLGFGSPNIEVIPTVASYISFITRLLIATGLIFQLPLVLFFLAKLRVIDPKILGGIRRYVIVAAFIISAIVTPTPDPFNQLLVAIPILVLYEVGALLARFA
ncbi:MAG: twin-arginine translocase subunit TatC [Chloroflexi bacterium]|nr:twin-arginine translocase subunit TatC [Chloroflexota bacterium]